MHTPHARNALLPRILGVALLAMAIALVVGGGQLIGLGGSWYYLLAGLGVGASALLLLTHRGQALLVFAAVLAGSTVWAWWEVHLDWWQLVPRLALWFVVGLVLWLPWVRNSLADAGRLPANALLVALVLAGGTALAAQFTEPHRFPGMIDRAAPASAPTTPPAQPAGDWQAYGRSNAGDRYSPLDQITPENVDQLELAWSYRTGDLPGPDDPQETTAENTPLKANGLLYVCTPHSQVIALDPDSGREIWRFDPKISTQDADSFKGWAHMTCRGVAYHQQDTPGSGQRCERRLFLPTADTRLMALDADDGKPCEDFGDKGSIDLTRGIGSFTPGGYYSTSPPGVSRDLVIIGGHVTDNVSEDEPSGVIRAYDVRDGHLVWNWDPGRPDDTAPLAEGRTYTRNSPNMWSVMSLDEELGLLYLPMGNQTPDQWGGRRTPASETYSAGVTALEIATGKVRWTFQMTHHDLWDMDVGGQPTLVDLPGQKPGDAPRPALIASTKQGSLYVLDRRTGQPIVPVKETPVPQGAAKGDFTAPTQPMSALNLMPPPLRERDMWGGTPFDQMLCRIQFRSLRYEGIYTPPSEQGSLVYPGNFGVLDWGGIAVDPVRQVAFLNPNYMAFTSRLIPAEHARDEPARKSEIEGVQPNTGAPFGAVLAPLLSPLGLPCQSPPWGYVAGLDLTTLEIAWKHKNGTVRDSSPLPLPLPMGVPSLGGPIVTAGGVAFLAGTLDQYLRAYDLRTGEQLWQGRLPAGGQATPMTYTGKDGRQYVLVVAGGHGSLHTRQGDYVLAFALPRR
ncbi:glucose/quinate/shikimate family membrane-bound PQQ-dependent dehydrogenase [Pseudomonas sp. zfem003]|uniref:glucose/quinate/shikimate family membrane-bound PQQ-dependent dehydrogenase n=1 Tax=Pseudomonas sp. zfem003 TaxID=3078198 RepID=UPI002927E388|nr:glucose/quinate/shikimate family membrane-bound PQQ-dependent dehydrogenase [Pseudomonas sp. zfem003]MDU9395347.1 glucose/quinate/shikimate family membrane-bound PQQ-dependent dehydrogenase [Pseudomonas sp. zfem003]